MRQRTCLGRICIGVMRFVDTNILIYASSGAPEDAAKSTCAQELLTARDLALSVQVLQEFYVQSTRVSRDGALTHQEAVSFATSMYRYPVQDVTLALMESALGICRRFQLSYWDSAILAAARTLGCQTILSEDLSQDQDYDGLRVSNPFV